MNQQTKYFWRTPFICGFVRKSRFVVLKTNLLLVEFVAYSFEIKQSVNVGTYIVIFKFLKKKPEVNYCVFFWNKHYINPANCLFFHPVASDYD